MDVTGRMGDRARRVPPVLPASKDLRGLRVRTDATVPREYVVRRAPPDRPECPVRTGLLAPLVRAAHLAKRAHLVRLVHPARTAKMAPLACPAHRDQPALRARRDLLAATANLARLAATDKKVVTDKTDHRARWVHLDRAGHQDLRGIAASAATRESAATKVLLASADRRDCLVRRALPVRPDRMAAMAATGHRASPVSLDRQEPPVLWVLQAPRGPEAPRVSMDVSVWTGERDRADRPA